MKTTPTNRSDTRQRSVTATLTLSMLLASLGTSIANIALPTLARTFSVPLEQVRWVVVAYLTGLTISTLLAGQLGDRLGLKRVLVAGLILFGCASLTCGLASDFRILVCARAAQGVGAACLMTLSMALMRETAGETRLGRAMGLLGTVSALGTALGPSLGGLVIATTGWRGVFLVLVPLTVAASIFAIVALPPDRPRDRIASVPLKTVLNARLMPNLTVNVLVAAVMMTTLVVGPFHLGLGIGLTDLQTGLVMTVGPLISIVTGIPSGRLVDAHGARPALLSGLAMLAAGTLLLALAAIVGNVAGYILAIAVLTPGYQLFQSANNMMTLANVAQERRGTVSGLLGLSRNIGLIVGASMMAALFAFSSGAADPSLASPAAIRLGTAATFASAGGLMIVALATVLAAGLRRR